MCININKYFQVSKVESIKLCFDENDNVAVRI